METDQCKCGQGREDKRHFLFHCLRYNQLQGDLIREARCRYGDLSYILGGRSSVQNPDGSNPNGPLERWTPNLTMVRTAIRFALRTGRLGPQSQDTVLTHDSQPFGT